MIVSRRALKFKVKSHADLRVEVYKRDKFTCLNCGAMPAFIPLNYDGRYTLNTTRRTKTKRLGSGRTSGGNEIPLVLDHLVSRRNGGINSAKNLQTLCYSCNAAKSGLIDSKRGIKSVTDTLN